MTCAGNKSVIIKLIDVVALMLLGVILAIIALTIFYMFSFDNAKDISVSSRSQDAAEIIFLNEDPLGAELFAVPVSMHSKVTYHDNLTCGEVFSVLVLDGNGAELARGGPYNIHDSWIGLRDTAKLHVNADNTIAYEGTDENLCF